MAKKSDPLEIMQNATKWSMHKPESVLNNEM